MRFSLPGWKGERALPLLILLSCVLFFPLFIFQGWGLLDFWWAMSLSLALLIGAALISDPEFLPSLYEDFRKDPWKKIGLGVLSAAILYLVFYFGNIISRRLFESARQEIPAIYAFKGQAAPVRIFILMVFLIGPGEEIFWRGYLQRALARRLTPISGYWLATALYAGVHLASGNLMLVLAALTCGLAWGWLYFKFHSVLLNAVSHTLWDLAVFIIFPLG